MLACVEMLNLTKVHYEQKMAHKNPSTVVLQIQIVARFAHIYVLCRIMSVAYVRYIHM